MQNAISARRRRNMHLFDTRPAHSRFLRSPFATAWLDALHAQERMNTEQLFPNAEKKPV